MIASSSSVRVTSVEFNASHIWVSLVGVTILSLGVMALEFIVALAYKSLLNLVKTEIFLDSLEEVL